MTNPPFSLSYETLLESLITSDRWLIAGYSFRDECVNDLLAEAWDARSDVPEVMIVTHGEELTEKTVTDALAWNWATDPFLTRFSTFAATAFRQHPRTRPGSSGMRPSISRRARDRDGYPSA